MAFDREVTIEELRKRKASEMFANADSAQPQDQVNNTRKTLNIHVYKVKILRYNWFFSMYNNIYDFGEILDLSTVFLTVKQFAHHTVRPLAQTYVYNLKK